MSRKEMQIGVFGGTFDPIHRGHLDAARAACGFLNLDRLIWVPNRQSPLRLGEDRTPGSHRLAMVECAIAGDERFEVSDLEVKREGPSYLIDTLEALKKQHPKAEWHFLMGMDSLDTFDRWVRVEDIVKMVKVWVMPRPGGEAQRVVTHLEERAPHLAKEVHLLEGPQLDISATEIRKRIEKGHPITDLVPSEVSEYISEHNLYN